MDEFDYKNRNMTPFLWRATLIIGIVFGLFGATGVVVEVVNYRREDRFEFGTLALAMVFLVAGLNGMFGYAVASYRRAKREVSGR